MLYVIRDDVAWWRVKSEKREKSKSRGPKAEELADFYCRKKMFSGNLSAEKNRNNTVSRRTERETFLDV